MSKRLRFNKRSRLTVFLLLGMAGMMNAAPVETPTIREVAMKFVNANADTPLQGVDDLQLVATYWIDRGDAAFHIFNTPNGFVIVSADDCATPILGYSMTGQFDKSNLPPALEAHLLGFVEQIEYGVENRLEADENTARQWELVRTTGRLNDGRDGEAVEPMVTALWGQGCYYNAMCPENPNGQCGHVRTGCAAMAMGMIMHYWNYPSQGSGTHAYTPSGYPQQSVNFGETIYNWADMPDQLTETSTQEEIDAVSTLLWHCGVSINTRYGSLVSTAYADLIPDALMDYFNYSDEIFFPSDIVYDENLPLWYAMIKNDLFHGHPILYLGANPNDGHAWVCDGIDTQDLLHFNWGWDGQNNGYYSLYAGIGYAMQSAIFNIFPEGDPGSTTQVIDLTQGWNWFSLFVEMNPTEALAMLEEGLGGNALLIKSRNGGYVEYDDEEEAWFGTLTQLTNEDMYMIQVTTACTVELEGSPANPSSHAITINPGWNWIGFPCNEEMDVGDAFAGFDAAEDDKLKSREAYTEFDGDGWFGTLNMLVPGQGYLYYSNDNVTKTLVFQTGAKTRH